MSSLGRWVTIAVLLFLGAAASVGARPADFVWIALAMAFWSLLFSAIGVGFALVAISIARFWKPELVRDDHAVRRGLAAGVIGFSILVPLPRLLRFDGGIYLIPLYAAILLGFITSLGLIIANSAKPPSG